ncbi:hypothetical protein FFZ86_08915 [Campylobacter jejuni]|nr:hypothetical protein [Campylobacter jejuni]EAV9779474.1 hypothetical protein [Campylobacter jejuni]ECW2121486.1 hypothetical protein [Campylobacter jejuni]EDP5522164.1 hypothetical protein [Campylobacter jejuni]ELT3919940.1 hypothetical protein [Campylobacter jejuni]
MFVGFSKNLGNGFRIGIGYNLNNNKPSKRDNDREEFVSKVLSEIKNLFQEIGCLTYIVLFFIFMLIISFITHEDKTNNLEHSKVEHSNVDKKTK